MALHRTKMLNDEQLAVALRLNPYYHRKLSVRSKSLGDPSSPEYAYAVAEIQHDLGLHVDGVLGPRTDAVMGAHKIAGVADYLIIGGKKIKVPFPVVDWTEPGGMSFYDFPACWRARTRRPDLFVLHWDVCRSSQTCFQVLVQRGLSVHLLVDGDENATVYQCLDLATATAWHASSGEIAGPENSRSIGVEINNPVTRDIGGRPIAVNQPMANGSTVWNHFDFTDKQKVRVVELCEAVCREFNLPRSIPSGHKLISYPPAGVCGHYHLKSSKMDPGLTLWPVLEAAGFDRSKKESAW